MDRGMTQWVDKGMTTSLVDPWLCPGLLKVITTLFQEFFMAVSDSSAYYLRVITGINFFNQN